MSFESDFFAAMDVSGQSLFPGVAPQNSVAPYGVWIRVFSERENSLAGFTSGLEKVRVQLDCYADTFDGAVALADSFKVKADASATMKILVLNEQDFFEDDTRLHRRMLELSCMHKS
jgi:hypothetical protein